MNISDMKLTPEEYRWVDDWLQMWGSWVYSGRLEKRMSSVIAKFMEAADPTRVMPTRPMCNDDDGLLISQVVDRVIASVDKRALGVLLSYYAHGSSKYGIASYYHKTANPRKVECRRGGVRMRAPSLATCRREVEQLLESSLWMVYQGLHPAMRDRDREVYARRMKKIGAMSTMSC